MLTSITAQSVKWMLLNQYPYNLASGSLNLRKYHNENGF